MIKCPFVFLFVRLFVCLFFYSPPSVSSPRPHPLLAPRLIPFPTFPLFFFFFFSFGYARVSLPALSLFPPFVFFFSLLFFPGCARVSLVQNPEFFFSYHARLKIRDQIVAFNYLVDQQVKHACSVFLLVQSYRSLC